MTPLTITPNLEIDPWADLKTDPSVIDQNGVTAKIERVGVLPNGTNNGRACVEMLILLPDGRRVIAETTLRLFNFAAVAIANSPVAQMEDL